MSQSTSTTVAVRGSSTGTRPSVTERASFKISPVVARNCHNVPDDDAELVGALEGRRGNHDRRKRSYVGPASRRAAAVAAHGALRRFGGRLPGSLGDADRDRGTN